MSANTGPVMTLANSIIGVSVLAMPFCFKECGIALATFVLILCGITTRLACHLLLKLSVLCKRRNFEFIAYHSFGPSGKLLVELGIIGFLLGTCVAFFVVIGDLGPAIVSKIFSLPNNSTLRTSVLVCVGIFIVLPLGLLRNIESLAAVSILTIGFYFLLVIKIFSESFPHLLDGNWIDNSNFWRPEGVFQCIPIFAMALACQTQMFEIYDSLPVPSIDKMNSVIRAAVNISTIVYVSVGMLGYVAFSSANFTGNILLSFAPSFTSDLYKFGFVMSLAASFPLVIFPCRASLYSLLFSRVSIYHDLTQSNAHIPDSKFKCLTMGIVAISLATGLLIPSIELVLGFVGATIGVAICVLFPALAFMNLNHRETNERLVAKCILVVGLVIMVMGTYGNLDAAADTKPVDISPVESQIIPEIKSIQKPVILSEETKGKLMIPSLEEKKPPKLEGLKPVASLVDAVSKEVPLEKRKEPPVPVPPDETKRQEPPVPVEPDEKPKESPPSNPKLVSVETEIKAPLGKSLDTPLGKLNIPVGDKKEEKVASKGHEVINEDAIKREEKEMLEIEKQKKSEEDRKQQELLQKLKEHEDEQKKLLQEQENILREMKNRDVAKNEPEKKSSTAKPPLDSIKLIKAEKFSENIAKIQSVIDNLKEKKNEMEKEGSPSEVKKIIAVADSDKNDQKLRNQIVSLPLPLVKLQADSKNAASEEKKRPGREILADVEKEAHREKRDTEGEDCQPEKETDVKSALVRDIQINNTKKEVDDENCKKGDGKEVREETEEIKNGKESVVSIGEKEEIIKSSLHLSPPEDSRLEKSNVENVRQEENSPLARKKRDLKSVILTHLENKKK